MSSKNQHETNSSPGPVPLPPPNRRSSFSQNPSLSTLFGSQRGSPPRTAPDPSAFSRRFSWSFAPSKESTSAIDDSEDITSPTEEMPRRGSEIGRRLSNTAASLKEALGLKFEEPPSPGTVKTNPFQQRKPSSTTSESEGGVQSFMQRRRASFGKTRSEADPHADRMLQGHFSVD